MTKEELLDKYGSANPQKFGSHGFVYLVDTMGDDQAIAQAARVSYGAGTKQVQEDDGLIRYLMRNHHTSPIEQAEIKLHIKCPIHVFRQMVRHRTASLNEYSTRYSLAIDDMEVASSWRGQALVNKQGSDGTLTEWPEFNFNTYAELFGSSASEVMAEHKEARDLGVTLSEFLSAQESEFQAMARRVYRERLALGVAREQARKDLPLSNYTEVYWKQDLHNILHFMWLRNDSHAQLEIRELAECIGNILEDWVPATYSAFNDYRKYSLSLSAQEQEALIRFLPASVVYELTNQLDSWDKDPQKRKDILSQAGLSGLSERIDFVRKLRILIGETQ